MSEPTPNASPVHKAGSFLMQETAGIPNWGWVLTIAAGIVLAVIVPRFLGKSNTGSTTQDTSGDTIDSGNGSSGIGLAIDPTTGLPYAVSGLVPSGGNASGGGTDLSPFLTQLSTLQTQQTADETTAASNQTALQSALSSIRASISALATPPPTQTQPTPAPAPQPTPQQTAPQPVARYVTVTKWPSLYGTLSGIASANGVSLSRIEQLNPQISNPNLIYPGQQVRVA